MAGLTLKDQIALVRIVAMLCAKQGWHSSARGFDEIRDELLRQQREAEAQSLVETIPAPCQ